MLKIVLEQLLRAILEYKWYVVIFAAAAVLFCGIIFFMTRGFDWSRRKIRAFAIFYNLNPNGRVALSLLLGRLVFIFCMVVFGGSEGMWDLLVLLIFCIAIAISARSWKELLHVISYAAVYIVSLMENLFIGFYKDVDGSVIILIVGITFGVFAVLFSLYQSLSSYNNLLIRSAQTDKAEFDKIFYEKEKQSDILQNSRV